MAEETVVDDKVTDQQVDTTNGDGKGTPKGVDTTKDGKGPPALVKHATFGELDADTAEWLGKRDDIKDVRSLAKIARDKDSMVGKQAEQLAKAIVPPGEKATPEEIKAYNEKMGIGTIPEDYKFEAPKDLPENLPYDGERAKAFAELAVKEKLTKKQAQAVHDWAVANAVGDFNGASKAEDDRQVALAKTETEKLTKLYGPVDGEQFRTMAAFADKALQLGGDDVLQDMIAHKDIVEVNGQKIVQRSAMFTLLAKVGQSLYKEGDVIRGNPSQMSNPFMDGDQENITEQGRLIQSDRPRAMALIAAAGKKPGDFGLTA